MRIKFLESPLLIACRIAYSPHALLILAFLLIKRETVTFMAWKPVTCHLSVPRVIQHRVGNSRSFYAASRIDITEGRREEIAYEK